MVFLYLKGNTNLVLCVWGLTFKRAAIESLFFIHLNSFQYNQQSNRQPRMFYMICLLQYQQ